MTEYACCFVFLHHLLYFIENSENSNKKIFLVSTIIILPQVQIAE